jgi:CubicO group peptidase (beta-lactamase class C family)
MLYYQFRRIGRQDPFLASVSGNPRGLILAQWGPFPMHDVQGRVQAVLDDLVASGVERGLQVAIYHGEELVVDAWAGVADPATGRLVDGDTLFTVFSTTKGIVATLIHILVARGTLDYDSPIARYWPEFGAHGKEGITVRHALTHTAGIPQMPDGVEIVNLCDWTGMCRLVADLRPLWSPGTFTGYHALTVGWILGGLAEHATGRSLPRLVRDEICAPLGISSLYLGVDAAVEGRVAELVSAPPRDADPTDPPLASPFAALSLQELNERAIPAPLQPLEVVFNRPELRRAVVPAAGGVMNARAIARHYAALAGGTLDGVQLLAPEVIGRVSALGTADGDVVLGAPIRKGLGYFLGGPHMPVSDAPAAFGHPGHGGSLGFADPEHRFAFGFTKNYIIGGPGRASDAAYLVLREARAALHLS